MTVWNHNRKGRIEGTIVREDDEWVTIRLAHDHTIRVMSADDDGFREADEPLTVRKSFLTELTPWEGVIAVEGVASDDFRLCVPGSLRWADPPIPLRDNASAGVTIGSVERIWRDGKVIRGAGYFDTAPSQPGLSAFVDDAEVDVAGNVMTFASARIRAVYTDSRPIWAECRMEPA